MIAVLVGTRPEIIKVAPILRILNEENIPHIFIHSNQHYSYEMDAKIIKDLDLKKPDYNLNVGSASHASQTGEIMRKVEEVCIKHKPSILLVHGDTNTTLAGALAAKKLHIKVGHIEAGLRSFDYDMPEEINRILVDRISDILFAPTQLAKENLLKEGINENQILITGNTVVDALKNNIEFAKENAILINLKLKANDYILVTAHRPENVDKEDRLNKLVQLVEYASKTLNKKIVWPLHPRTKNKIAEFKIKTSKNIIFTKSVGYIEMLSLLHNANLVMTDSGGIQEEAYILKKPLITMRDSTERPETLTANFIIDNNQEKFDEAISAYKNNKVKWTESFGQGNASDLIVEKLLENSVSTTVSVLGLGYIGLPTALLLANSGVKTFGYDIDESKVNTLNKNKLFFEENGLNDLFTSVQKKETFSASTMLKSSNIYIIAVPTPQKKGSAELKYVKTALKEIKKTFEDGNLIILESTVGPRDCIDIIIPLIKSWKKKYLFSHCPERAIPGNTLFEMKSNDRIIGGIDKNSNKETSRLYSKFVDGELFQSDPTTAAACKVMENTYRANNIALANEFAKIAEDLDFDVWEAIELANKHPRVNIHYPGPGVGGHCIPIDPWFFINKKQKGSLIEMSLIINNKMAHFINVKVNKLIKSHKINKAKIGILGYSYKKNVDDYRDTPSQRIYDFLSKNHKVKINDPFINDKGFLDLNEILLKSNVIILSTDHDKYKNIDFSKYPNIKFIYDTRNLFTRDDIKNTNIALYKLGSRN
jgi:UDP-N-acetylglucosamine 2-epimerase (non-hydrolysing)